MHPQGPFPPIDAINVFRLQVTRITSAVLYGLICFHPAFKRYMIYYVNSRVGVFEADSLHPRLQNESVYQPIPRSGP